MAVNTRQKNSIAAIQHRKPVQALLNLQNMLQPEFSFQTVLADQRFHPFPRIVNDRGFPRLIVPEIPFMRQKMCIRDRSMA